MHITDEEESTVSAPPTSAQRPVDRVGWTGVALGAALVAMTLVAGLSFTFAAAVMPNLADADDHTFVVITQRFNQNPVFPLTFTLAPLLVACAAVLARRQGRGATARWAIAAAVLCGIVLAITGGVHVPLNMDIDQVDPERVAGLADARDQFEGPWVVWNLVRTLFATATVAALARALFLHGRNPFPRSHWMSQDRLDTTSRR